MQSHDGRFPSVHGTYQKRETHTAPQASKERKEKERAKVTKEHEDTKNTKLAIEKKRHEDLLQSYREKEDEHTNARSKMKTLEDRINTLKEVTNKLEIDNKTKEEKIEGLNYLSV